MKIRWSTEERMMLLAECKRQHEKHPAMLTLNIVAIAQNVVFTPDRRRSLKGNDQVKWVQEARNEWVIKDKYVPIKELPPEPSKPDIMAQLVDLLSDAMVQIVSEAIVAARVKLDLPIIDIADELHPKKPQCANLKKIAVYGLFSNQVSEVRNHFKDCFEFRFLKDVSQAKLVSAAHWADVFIVMTKFVSHDYEAIKKFGNVRYLTGASSGLIDLLETMYLEESK